MNSVEKYIKFLSMKGEHIGDAPQPFGREVADYIRTHGSENLPYLVAYLMRDLDFRPEQK